MERTSRPAAGQPERGFTLIELLIVIAVVGLLASTAMAVYRNSRADAQAAAAIASLRTITSAQFGYAQTCGNQRYAPSLSALGTPAPSTGIAFLSPDLTAADIVEKSGYQITMAGTEATDDLSTCTGVRGVVSYQATADPIAPGISGTRCFGTNSDRAIFEDTATFAGNMPETGAPGHGSEVKEIR